MNNLAISNFDYNTIGKNKQGGYNWIHARPLITSRL